MPPSVSGVPQQAFVDENKTRGLLMAAAICPADKVNASRKAMSALLLPRQRRIHFQKESPARQRKILSAVGELPLSVNLYLAPKANSDGRARCLAAIVGDLSTRAERLIIERDTSTLEFDRQVLFQAVRRFGCAATLQYELLAPHLDPMLWIPDAIVWAWAKGGEWRQLIRAEWVLNRV